MPVEVIKYTCQFKCFRKAMGDFKKMEAHESQCWNNPKNETCKTCKNQVSYTDNDGLTYWPVRECKIDKLNEVFDRLYDKLRHETSLQVRPVYHCNYHNKDEDGCSNEFADELLKEYGTNNTGTYHFPYHQPVAAGEYDVFGNKIIETEPK